MNITELSIRRPVTTIMLFVSMVAIGLIASFRLPLEAEPEANIVCFRYAPPDLGEDALRAINTEIMLRLQESGRAAVSDTTLHGRHCLRAAIANHRTRRSDLDAFVADLLRVGAEVERGARPSGRAAAAAAG